MSSEDTSDMKLIQEFAQIFDVEFQKQIYVRKKSPRYDVTNLNELQNMVSLASTHEPAYQFVIRKAQLERLIRMLRDKGYYHDEAYDTRIKEEDLILKNPDLKRLHDEYKMMLYLLCGENT